MNKSREYPSVCVIIPTRERKKTLEYTIRTCLNQDYAALTILICDNYSNDGTEELVHSFNDSKIVYCNPGKRLSMSENWEYAIDNALADYVTVIGDDDGLLPSAINNAIAIITKHKSAILAWKKAEYTWPDYPAPHLRNRLVLPRFNNLLRVSGQEILRHIVSLRFGYSLGPCIYNSIVSKSLIEDIKKRDGKFFRSMCPDVFSSLNFSEVVEDYLLSSRPFSVNGASSSSNGTSAVGASENAKPYDMFVKEYFGIQNNQVSFGIIKGSLTAAIAESLLIFSDSRPYIKKQIKLSAIFQRILGEALSKGTLNGSNLEVITALAKQHNQEKLVQKFMKANRSILDSGSKSLSTKSLRTETNELIIDVKQFSVENVFSAAQLAERILGNYEVPDQTIKFSYWKYVISKIFQKLQKSKFNLGL